MGQRHAPAALYPQERPGTHSTGGWVGPRAGLDRCGIYRPPPGFNPRTVQPVSTTLTGLLCFVSFTVNPSLSDMQRCVSDVFSTPDAIRTKMKVLTVGPLSPASD